MKKILLSIAAMGVSIFSFSQAQRMVLIEEFTNASCGPCASQNPAYNTLLAENMNKVVQIKYQTVWPGTDPMNAQNPTDVATRVTEYNVSGVPFSVVDGDTLKNPQTANAYAGAPANVTQTMIDNEYALSSPFTLSATYSYNTTTDSFTSVVTFTNVSSSPVNASAAGQLKLMFALVEMNINFATAPGSNGETEFYYVMRKMYPSVSGTTLSDVIAPGASVTYTFKEKAPTYIYAKPQMAVVAFIQDLGNNKVHQATYGFPSGLIDAKAEYTGTNASTDLCAATLNPVVKITNNATTPITSATVGYTVNGAGGTSQNWTGNLAAGQSANVTFPAITAPVGSNFYEFYANNFNNGAIDLIEANNVIDPTLAQVVGTANNPFYETFETSAVGDPTSNQSILNIFGGSTVVDKTILSSLTQKLGAYGQSDKSYRFRFYTVPPGYRLGLTFYKNNLSGKGLDKVTFDYAYNNYTDANGSDYDTLALLVSSDCGNNWTEIWNQSGTNLKTTSAAGLSTNYYPAVTEWKQGIASLPASFTNATELLLKVEGRSGYGNNLYVDNIRFWYPNSVENVANENISVFPIPTSSDLHVNGIKGDATFSFVDVTGRMVRNVNMTNIASEVILNTTGLAKGSYTLKISQAGNTTTKTVVIAD